MNEHVEMSDDEEMINQNILVNVWVELASNDS